MKSTTTSGAKTIHKKVMVLQHAVIQKPPQTVPDIEKISLKFLRTP